MHPVPHPKASPFVGTRRVGEVIASPPGRGGVRSTTERGKSLLLEEKVPSAARRMRWWHSRVCESLPLSRSMPQGCCSFSWPARKRTKRSRVGGRCGCSSPDTPSPQNRRLIPWILPLSHRAETGYPSPSSGRASPLRWRAACGGGTKPLPCRNTPKASLV